MAFPLSQIPAVTSVEAGQSNCVSHSAQPAHQQEIFYDCISLPGCPNRLAHLNSIGWAT